MNSHPRLEPNHAEEMSEQDLDLVIAQQNFEADKRHAEEMKLTDEEFRELAYWEPLPEGHFHPDNPIGQRFTERDLVRLFQACVERCGDGLRIRKCGDHVEIWEYNNGGRTLTCAPTFEAAVREFARRLTKNNL